MPNFGGEYSDTILGFNYLPNGKNFPLKSLVAGVKRSRNQMKQLLIVQLFRNNSFH